MIPMATASGITNKIGSYVSSLLKKSGKAADEVEPPPKLDPDAPPPKEEPPVEEPTIEPEGPPQIAPEGAPDTSLNIPRALELAEDMRQPPRPGIATEGRPKGSNLNLRTMTEDPRVKQIAELLDEGQEGFRARRSRKKVTTADSVAKSEDIRVLQRAIGKNWDSSWTHEEIIALGQMNKDVTILLKEKADELIVAIDAGTVSGSEEIAFAYLENQAIMVQQKMTDAAAASGRSLQAFRKLQTATNRMEYQQASREMIELQGGAEALRERIRMYAQGKNLEDIYKAKNTTLIGKTKNFIMQARYNSMLSGIRTHVANITGSGFFTVYENLAIRPLQTIFNRGEQAVRSLPGLPPMKPEDVMYFRENWAAAKASREAGMLGFTKAWRTFLGKERDIGPTKMSVEGPGRLSRGTIPESTAGKIATSPTRALEAEDVAFRVINSHMELARLAYREARTTATTPGDAQRLYNELMEHPPEHLRAQAQAFGERSTFINDPNLDSQLLGGLATHLAAAQQNNMFIQFVAPFIRTPANLMIYAKNNIGMSSKLVTDYFTAGPIKRAEWNARISGAMGLYVLTRGLYEEGKLTGVGNPNKTVRRAEQKTGANPLNSIKFGDKWYQLNRMDPAAMSIGMMTTLHEQLDYYEGDKKISLDAILSTGMEVSQLMLDRSMLSGISQVMEVMQGSTGAAKTGDIAGMIAGLPAIASPGILRDVRMMTDPVMREMEPEGLTTKGVGQRIWKRWMNSIPGLSSNLPPKRDWRGDVKEYQGNTFYRGLVPVPIVDTLKDTASSALIQYGVSISRIQPKFIIPGAGIPLNTMEIDGGKGWAYNKLEEFIGKKRSEYLDDFVDKDFVNDTKEIIQDGVVMDPFQYEINSEHLSRMMSEGRRQGILDFLEWIEGKKEIPGPDGKMIPVQKVIKEEDYYSFAEAYQEGQPIESDVYKIPPRTISPGAQSTVTESVEF